MMRTSSPWHQLVLLLVTVITIAGCSGGGTTTDQTVADETPGALSTATIVVSNQPRIDQPLMVSVKQSANTGNDVQRYIWSVLSQPAGANLTLTPAPDDGVIFTPVVAGDYRLRVASELESAAISLFVSANLPFLTGKVSLYEGSFADETYVGRVTNQVWLYSQTLDQSMLEQLAVQYPAFQIIGFDSVNGLLLQFDESSQINQASLDQMRLASGVVSVVHRIVTGINVIDEAELTPDDGSSFNDGGDNWHLERIGAEQAWDVTTGSSNILIGVSEPEESVFSNHEDLAGRFGLILSESSGDDSSHPSAVAGTVAAISNNGKGISGLNWVSKISMAGSGEDELRRLAGSGSTKVINSSWALLKAPNEGTDMSDDVVASAREQDAFDLTRNYRKLMREFPNHLFVNSAGNGVKGPDGTAIDGRYHSPALHYSQIGRLSLVPNAIFVAAMQEDGKLRESSNYGESVEIAAPAGYKSIDGENGYDTFSSTSAAAPVVSGVASLIYSVNPNFSAANVKDILLSTATEFVTERHTESGNDGETETLAHPIPVVNAAKALQLAESLAAGLKANVSQYFDNPFVNRTNVQVLSATREFSTTVFTYELNGVSGVSTGSEAEITLHDPTDVLMLSSNNVKFRHKNLDTTVTGEFQQTLENPNIAFNLFNKDSYLPVSNAEITLEPVNAINARFDSFTGPAGADGQTRVYLMSGLYRVVVKAVGYEEHRTLINIVNDGQRIFVNLPLASATDTGDPVGTGLDQCLIGKWALDITHLQAQLDPGVAVFGNATARMLPNGVSTTDMQLTYTISDPADAQATVITITQSGTFKFEWSTGNDMFFVESRGSTVNETSTVTIDGVTVEGGSGEPPVTISGPGDSRSPYSCNGNVWIVEAAGENNVTTRFNRL